MEATGETAVIGVYIALIGGGFAVLTLLLQMYERWQIRKEAREERAHDRRSTDHIDGVSLETKATHKLARCEEEKDDLSDRLQRLLTRHNEALDQLDHFVTRDTEQRAEIKRLTAIVEGR